MGKLELQFGVPQAGWLPVFLKTQLGAIELDVSDVPTDSLLELARGALKVKKAKNEHCVINWHLEPSCSQWCLCRNGPEFSLAVRSNREEPYITMAVGMEDDVLEPIYEGLRKLKDSYEWDSDDLQSWSNSFPSAEVAALGRCLGRETA